MPVYTETVEFECLNSIIEAYAEHSACGSWAALLYYCDVIACAEGK